MKSNSTNFDFSLFKQMPIIGILRNVDLNVLPYILEVFYEAGLTTIEITMNSHRVEEQIRYSVANYGAQLNIGAGTVRNQKELSIALDSGAEFIVSPNVDEEVIIESINLDIPIFPGAFTPTEVYRAHKLGALMIKVYPATALGPEYFNSLQGTIDAISLIPTGGINRYNMIDYIRAGVFGFGIGSTLFDKEIINRRDWKALKLHMAKFVEIMNTQQE